MAHISFSLVIYLPTDSLEDRVEHYAKKRKLNSGEEELVPSTSETEWAESSTVPPYQPSWTVSRFTVSSSGSQDSLCLLAEV